MAPVYARSYIFGSSFDADVLQQTLIRRADGLSLPSPFVFVEPLLSGVANYEPEPTPGVSDCFSLNWSQGDSAMEIIDASAGRQASREPSRLCKRRLFVRFSLVCERLSAVTSVQSISPDVSYRQAKALARTHQAAKEALLAHLEPRLGYWLRKPHDLDGFSLQ